MVYSNEFGMHRIPALPSRRPLQKISPRRMRRYSTWSLTPDGKVDGAQHIAPATPDFEAAFSAFARGTLIATADGRVAIEDLQPGELIRTVHGDLQKLQWCGSMTLVPQMAEHCEARTLTRISADSFGLGRPMPDLMIGPGAKVFRVNPSECGVIAKSKTTTDLIDGEAVFGVTPANAVQLYHLAFAEPQTIYANGLECESFHPYSAAGPDLSGELRALFLSLFPYLGNPAVATRNAREDRYQGVVNY